MSPLRILVLYDGKAGHLSQSLGLAQLINRFSENRQVFVEKAQFSPRLKLLNRPLRSCSTSTHKPLLSLLPLAYRRKRPFPSRPDLLISFGGDVLALNIALSEYWGIPNIVIGNRYHIPKERISAHLTLQGEEGNPRAIASTIVLNRVQVEHCRREAEKAFAGVNTRLWTLLIGGTGSGYQYTTSDWHQLAEAAEAIAKRYGIRWLISNSRRSGIEVGKILLSHLSPKHCQQFVDVNDDQGPNIKALLGRGERIFCTEDSLSMVSEAVSMNKPVISLRPEQAQATPTHGAALAHLQQMGLLQSWDIAQFNDYRVSPWQAVKSYDAHLLAIYQQLQETGVIPASQGTPVPHTALA